MGRGGLPVGRVFEGEVDPGSPYSIPYGYPGYHPGMVGGYGMGYQNPYVYGNVFMGGYPYAFAQQYHPYAQMQQGGFDPRQHPMQYMAQQQQAQQQAQAARGMSSPTQR